MTTHACERITACVIVPLRGDRQGVAEVVKGCLAHARTVLACDDGATDGSVDRAREAGATVLPRPPGQEGSAALVALLAEANRRGFRYAICIDSGGQHRPADIPSLVDEVEKEPGQLVVGVRARDAAQRGGGLSAFWVWLLTGERLEGSPTGFRAYPLPETQLVGSSRPRHDFELDVLLRCAWAGLPVRGVPISAAHPDAGSAAAPARWLSVALSCLKVLLWPLPLAPLIRDRFRKPGLSLDALRRWAWLGGAGPFWRLACVPLSLLGAFSLPAAAALGAGVVPTALAWGLLTELHARGFGGVGAVVAVTAAFMLFGLIELSARNAMTRRAYAASGRQWGAPSRGGYWGHFFFVVVLKAFSPGFAYFWLYPVTLYFLFSAPENRRASMQFLDRAVGPATGVRRWVRSYRHFLTFARVIVDRVVLGALGAKAFSLKEIGVDHILDAGRAGKGMVLVTAHFGNYEVAAGLLGDRLTAPLALVTYQNELAHVRELLAKNEGPTPRLITAGNTQMVALEILRALRDGFVVAMPGDRTVDARTVRVPFLGQEAALPVGPFLIAAMSGSPMISTFNLQVGPQSYLMLADAPQTLRFERGRPRDEQIQAWAAAYARRLEELVKQHPYQWFNFYDFWAETPASPARAAAAESPPAAEQTAKASG